MTQVAATARFEARISPDLRALLKRAADLQGRSTSDFVMSAAREAATRVVEQAEVLRLSADDQARFAAALLAPPEPSAALQRAFKRRTELLATE
jgi:uncharacterized protein (DUF1778 family)